MFNSLRYKIARKYDPILDPKQRLNMIEHFTQKPWNKWDHENMQVFIPSQVDVSLGNFCKITAREATRKEMSRLEDEFKEDCRVWETDHRKKFWKYLSGALTSRRRVNVHKPGRLSMFSEIVHKGINPSLWLFDEWHGSDGNDELGRAGNNYFEVDVVESGPCAIQNKQCVFFSAHWGKSSSSRKMKNDFVRGDYSNRPHYYEVQWDGEGNFVWLMDGVCVFEKKIVLHPDVAPKILVTLGVTEDIKNKVVWRIQEVYFDGEWKR